MTDLTKAQIATILSALDERPRNPANRSEALKALAKSAGRYGLTTDEVLAAAPGLLDGRVSPEDFRAELRDRGEVEDLGEAPCVEITGAQPATDAQEPAPAPREVAAAGTAPEAAPKPAAPAPEQPDATRAQTPRAGTKQALMIDLLKRPEGATVEQIAEATGWQHHTIRGAISGALKKKLGLTVEATRTRDVGPNKTSAKGSSTVYRIVEPA
jgi:hypothetical protein